MLSSKRKRAQCNWSVTFEDASALKSIVEACAAVMQRIIVKISYSQDTAAYLLSVDGADVGYTCCVSARLRLGNVHMENDTEEFTFCVDCKQVLYSIDTPSCAHAVLVMESYPDDTGIFLTLSDPDQPSHVEKSRLNTYVDSDPPMRLSSLDFQLIIELDLTKLREMIKKSRKAHAEHLSINVLARGTASTTIFTIQGDTQHTQAFSNDVSKSEDGSRLVRAVADGTTSILMQDDDGVELLHEGTYPIDKIDAFVKTVPSRICRAKAMKGMPLMLTHMLGGSEDDVSHVRFLVAGTNEED